MLKFSSIFLSCLLPLAAEEARIPGGLSADGKYEVVVSDKSTSPDDSTDHEFVLRDNVSKKRILIVSAAVYAQSLKLEVDSEHLQQPNCAVLWNPSSTAFAFNLRDTKRTRSTSVFVFRRGAFEQMVHKDAFPLIAKELGISGVERCSFEDPLRWDDETTLILRSSGDCVLPNSQTDEGRWFEYEVTSDLTNAKPLSIKRLMLKVHNG